VCDIRFGVSIHGCSSPVLMIANANWLVVCEE
jgi:hypothetical protein